MMQSVWWEPCLLMKAIASSMESTVWTAIVSASYSRPQSPSSPASLATPAA